MVAESATVCVDGVADVAALDRIFDALLDPLVQRLAS